MKVRSKTAIACNGSGRACADPTKAADHRNASSYKNLHRKPHLKNGPFSRPIGFVEKVQNWARMRPEIRFCFQFGWLEGKIHVSVRKALLILFMTGGRVEICHLRVQSMHVQQSGMCIVMR